MHRREARRISLAERLGGEVVDHPADHVVDRQEGRDRWAAAAQLLEDQRRVGRAEPGAADLLAHADPGEAELGRLAQHVDRQMALAIPVERMRREALFGEGARHIDDRLLFVGR